MGGVALVERLCCTEGPCGQWAAGQVKSVPRNWGVRESVSSQVTGWFWEMDDKGWLTIVLEGGDRYVGQNATLERALTTEMLQCRVKGGVVLIPKLSSPRNTSCWESRKARPEAVEGVSW